MVSTKHTEDITDNYKKLDLLFGFAFHEAAHCVYTDFDCIRRQGMLFNPLTKFIHNILEDEEIDLSKETKGDTGSINLPKSDAYANEIIYFANCVKNNLPVEKVKPEELECVLKILNNL